MLSKIDDSVKFLKVKCCTKKRFNENKEIYSVNAIYRLMSSVAGTVSATTNTKLYQFVYEWLGTPYRLGGDSKRGIDCSKFSYELYDKVFNTSLGYNSRNQYSQVKTVEKNELKAGDLVFFKIRSKSITHVGVYIGDNKFAHASSSKGVMISNLDEPYWRRYYYNGGRLPEDNRSLTAEILKAEKDNKLN
ncbi:MAG: glycoside hydrolase [Sphingobacterium multivorum]|nr:glycoside hydrolase [Sphingobacterium multivorum]